MFLCVQQKTGFYNLDKEIFAQGYYKLLPKKERGNLAQKKASSVFPGNIRRKDNPHYIGKCFHKRGDLFRDHAKLSRFEIFELDYCNTAPALFIEVSEDIIRANSVNLSNHWASSERIFKKNERRVTERCPGSFRRPSTIYIEFW